MPEFLIWMHVCAMAAYVGAQFAVIYMLIPAAESAPDEAARRKALIAGFRFYNPFTIAVLGIIVITGAARLTDLKAMGEAYLVQIVPSLEIKLGLAFFMIFFQTYITFGLAFRIGRQEDVAAHGDGPAFTVEQVNSILMRIRAMAWLTIALAAAIIWVSLTMSERTITLPAAPGTVAARAASDASPILANRFAPRTPSAQRGRAYRISERSELAR